MSNKLMFALILIVLGIAIVGSTQDINKNNACKLHNGLVIETHDGKHLCLDKKSLLEESQ